VSDPWKIVETTEYKEWFASLSREQRQAIRRSTKTLQDKGPSLGRPIVDLIKGSELKNLKEMRVSSKGKLRILFIFDYRRQAFCFAVAIKRGTANGTSGIKPRYLKQNKFISDI